MVASWWLLPRLGIIAVGICWLASQTGGAVWVLASWRRICDAAVPAIAPESAQPSGSVAG
jgi:hypothetical protein